MSWEEIEYEFSVSKYWMFYIVTCLELNAQIDLSNKKFEGSHFSPLARHQIEYTTITEFIHKHPDPAIYHPHLHGIEKWMLLYRETGMCITEPNN